MLLVGRKLSLPRVTAIVFAAQALFHTAFGVISSASLPTSGVSGHHHAPMSLPLNEPTEATTALLPQAVMLIAHVLAAVVTVLALHRGEHLLRALATPEEAAAGSTSTLAFSFSHGCEDSPTTALVFDIPEGVGNVSPVVQGGWSIEREMAADGTPAKVTFTPDAPIESGPTASVSMDVLFESSTAGTSIAFPVTQECLVGAHAWTQIADGEDTAGLDSPAPVVEIGAIAAATGHGHSGSDTRADSDSATAAPADAATNATTDVVARWLAGAALLAGFAALAVSVLRRRRTRG